MKTIKIFITIAIVAITGNMSAQIIDTNKPQNSTIPTLEDFKKDFPKAYSNLDTSLIQNNKGDIVTSLKDLSNLDFFTLPVIINNNVVGRVYQSKGNISYVDYSNYKKEVKLNILRNDKSKTSFTSNMLYNSKDKTYSIDNNGQNRTWCEIGCTLGGIAIAISDGPLPVLDILAVATTAACVAGCNE
ncbi:MAG: hypothetical protein ACI9Y7_002517 [Dokdonia sp.]|jgi:hypothetical protein